MNQKDKHEEEKCRVDIQDESECTEPMRFASYFALTTMILLCILFLFRIHYNLYQSIDKNMCVLALSDISLLGWSIVYAIYILFELSWVRKKIHKYINKAWGYIGVGMVAVLASITIYSVCYLKIIYVGKEMIIVSGIFILILFLLSLSKTKDRNYSGNVLANIVAIIALIVAIISLLGTNEVTIQCLL